ncbi:MAG: TrkA C-terminal domain-containing protein [Dethiobacter sp.]|nr:TrkA C-terminal domain-containing protein [Dethiobacter sp.]MBS3983733.1 TrkA C-terminal domain-containing protein [Dethiobacter sp.]MCL4463514.1 TrkA C-terminal domain-containing protein [Bacillota bacterium]
MSILNAGLGGIQDILFFGVILFSLFLFLRNPRLITYFEGYLEKNLERSSGFCQLSEEALFNFDEYAVTEVVLTSQNAPLANRTLKETRLHDCGIIVLSIKRNGNVTYTPRGDDILLPGDTLLLYGRATQIKMYTEPAAN